MNCDELLETLNKISEESVTSLDDERLGRLAALARLAGEPARIALAKRRFRGEQILPPENAPQQPDKLAENF